MMTKHSFVIVSNRLPISVSKKDGKLTYESSSGGLATAMSSLREDDTIWVGWCGMPSDDLSSKDKQAIREHFAKHNAYPVFLTAAQIDKAIKQLYSESTAPNRPKNADIEQMKAFLMKNQRVATADLKQLADRRAAAVRNYLIQKEKVAADRLFISTSKTQRGDQVVPGVALGLQD